MPQVDTAVVDDVEPVFAQADPVRVRQIIRNLIANAIRHGGDRIEVRVARVGSVAVVDVRDDGPEIPRSVIQRMFEPYERGELDSTTPGSIGLGLIVARTLASLQQGDLVCVREGDCNVFRLTLPLAEGVEALGAVARLAFASD